MSISKENEKIIDSELNKWIDDFKKEHGNSPSGRDVTAHRHRLEIQYVSFSDLIKRLLKIGDPDSIDARHGEKDEFSRIAAELDRREKLYLKK